MNLVSGLLIALMIFIYIMQSFTCKKYSSYYPGDKGIAAPVFTVVSSFVVAAATFAFNGFSVNISSVVLVLGIINAFAVFAYDICLIKAAENGPYSVLMVFMIAGGIILPALGAACFGEMPSIGKILSVIVILISVYIISMKKDEKNNKVTKKFILYCLGLAISNGIYCMLFDIQLRLTGPEEKSTMIIITFLGGVLISALYILMKKKGEIIKTFRQSKKSAFYLAACSVCTTLAINLLVYILPLVNVTVLYTLNSASVFLGSVLLSCIFFKEKLSLLNWIGCVVMCVALVTVTIF